MFSVLSYNFAHYELVRVHVKFLKKGIVDEKELWMAPKVEQYPLQIDLYHKHFGFYDDCVCT